MKCPYCGAENPDTSKFCRKCGKRLVEQRGISYEVEHRPAYTLLKTYLNAGEEIIGEAGAMVYMTSNIELKTEIKGGLFSGLKRKVLGGESLFMNTFRCTEGKGEVAFAPGYPGDIVHIYLNNESWFAQGGAYIASSPTIGIDTKFQGLKGFISREGLFFLKLEGYGDLFLSAFGAISVFELRGNEFVVDTGHLVAFESGIDYTIKRAGGLKSTFLSGEGLVARLWGNGKVMIQTRNPTAFSSWLYPFLPKQR
ncbi:MAG: TIGR00266 family protein [Methanomicrobia archaeon]|nr:TIGR00266 family protein [Methanomicrobia archaeon]HDM22993.1 TIGR00266 family protein [Methanomicrobia archaeon]